MLFDSLFNHQSEDNCKSLKSIDLQPFSSIYLKKVFKSFIQRNSTTTSSTFFNFAWFYSRNPYKYLFIWRWMSLKIPKALVNRFWNSTISFLLFFFLHYFWLYDIILYFLIRTHARTHNHLLPHHHPSHTVTWLKYSRYGVKCYPINQAIIQYTYV